MTKLVPIKRNDFIKKLKKLGVEGPYSGGKHQFMIRGDTRLTLPNPHRKDIGIDLLKRILLQAGINREEWLKL